MNSNSFKLKDNFLLGVSTSSTQIEGGDVDNNWNDWYKKGHIKDNSSPSRANDHFNRWENDTDLLKEMKIEIYRFGLEWARINPEPNKFDTNVLNRYRHEILLLNKYNIKPLLTLHHFSNPMWFEKLGGFEKKENLKYFIDYVKVVLEFVGDIVFEYITINEPNVFATNGYLYGEWTPGYKSFNKCFKVLSNFSFLHIECYKIIHEYRKNKGFNDTLVSFANHVRPFDPEKKRHKLISKIVEDLFQGKVTKAMMTGKFTWPLKNKYKIKKGEYADFIGVNYYSRSIISGFHDGVKENTPKNDLGWEIYPEGLVRVSQKLYDILPRPIWITENGTCDNLDSFRCKYIYDHLKSITESNLPINRYYHWCFLDNWEWCEGESARFGLVHVNYNTQERIIKKSGNFYTELITNHEITEDMYNKYVKDEEYNIK